MKILDTTDRQVYEITISKTGENRMKCPSCTQTRRHKEKVSFSWNNEKRTGYCQNCNHSFLEYKPMVQQKEYKRPEWKNKTDLTDKAVKYFESRKITQKALNTMRVYSDNEWMPQANEHKGGVIEVMCFPYFYRNELINIKYRGALKSFKMAKDAELIFWNLDCLELYDEVIIVEGEIDLLSYVSVGMDNVLSVPNGAQAKDPLYLDNYMELFENKRVVIATDNDLPGINLRNELIRRFGAENCSTVDFKDKKDANEYLCYYGEEALKLTYTRRTEVPISGIVDLEKQYDNIYSLFVGGLKPGLGINDQLDASVTWETSRLAVWTGIPSHGKSEVLDWICVRLNVVNGWKTAYFSPENYPVSYHFSKISSKLTGKKFKMQSDTDSMGMTTDEFVKSFDYIAENFFFIMPDEANTMPTILEKAKYLVRKYGIKQLVIDPYNKISHSRDRGETETEYIGRLLDALVTFAQKNDILIHLVAHPTKMKKDPSTGKYEIPTLYDINGSANFYNKADYGITVYRVYGENPKTDIIVQKVKFKHLGDGGTIEKSYNTISGRYEDLGKGYHDLDFTNWIDWKPVQQVATYPDVFSIAPSNEFDIAPF